MASKIHEPPEGYVRVQDIADQCGVRAATLRAWCRRNGPDQAVEVIRPEGGMALWIAPELASMCLSRYNDAQRHTSSIDNAPDVDSEPAAQTVPTELRDIDDAHHRTALPDDERRRMAERERELLDELVELRVEVAVLETERDLKTQEIERWVKEIAEVRRLASVAAERAEERQAELVDRVGELERAAGFYAERLDTIIKWAWNVAKTPRWRLLLGRRPEVPELGYSAIQDLRGGRR